VKLKLPILFFFVVSTTWAAEPDILEQAAAHPRGAESVEQADGSWVKSKYGDHRLAEAGTFLSTRYPRPWTVTQTLAWLQSATDDGTRVHLLRLLAASRDPRAALILGAAINSDSPDVRMAACYGLLDYFVTGGKENGGTEQHITDAQEWFASNKARLRSEAAAK
jgi:hypothetical protein